MRVLVGGGTGFIGRHLQVALQNKGYEVLNISRKAGAGKITWKDIEKQGLPGKFTAVVNLAGELLVNPARRFNSTVKADLIDSRVNSTRQLVDAISAATEKPDIFVCASAVGYYKLSAQAEYTEETPGNGDDLLADICHKWEAASQLPPDVSTRKVTVRIGGVLGKDGGMFKSMYWPFYLGLGGRVGSGTQWLPWVHVDDVCGIIIHAIENKNATGVLNGTSPNPVTNSEFTQVLARAMWRPAIFPMPAFVVNKMLSPEIAVVLLEGQKVLPKRTLESGYKFQYPEIREAIDQCLK